MQAEELRQILGANVRRRRCELGLTQSQLAEKLGIAQSYISALEKGKKSPLLETLADLADTLDVTPSALLSGSLAMIA